jgi:hypothetical protein
MDPEQDPAVFIFDFQDDDKNFLKQFFCILLFEGAFTSFFKDKKSKRSHKTVGIKVFFLDDIRSGSGSMPLTNGSGSGSRRPQKHTDPDSPQHCLYLRPDFDFEFAKNGENAVRTPRSHPYLSAAAPAVYWKARYSISGTRRTARL